MMLDYDQVKEDYKRKDDRIAELEVKLLKSLGLNEYLCGDIKMDVSIYENESWFFAIGPAEQKRLLGSLDALGINGHPNDYSCAADLLNEIVDTNIFSTDKN